MIEIDPPVAVRGVVREQHIQNAKTVAGDYLVASPEASLKRVLAAGSGDIYAIGHVFRAGEVGRWHNPEYTMLEWYRRGFHLDDIIEETDTLIRRTLATPPGARYRFADIFEAQTGIDPLHADAVQLAATARHFNVAPADFVLGDDRAAWIDLLMSLVVQPQLGREQPVFVTHFPIGDGVLTAPAADGCTGQRFELYYHGIELANGARELTDAELAGRRMAETSGNEALDERLLAAMTAGLPECTGVALGVDRLLALRLNTSDVASVMPFDWSRR